VKEAETRLERLYPGHLSDSGNKLLFTLALARRFAVLKREEKQKNNNNSESSSSKLSESSDIYMEEMTVKDMGGAAQEMGRNMGDRAKETARDIYGR
jgi:hypothetical protein